MNGYIENILHENKRLAIIIRSSFTKDGIEFFSQKEDSLQLGYMKRNEGYSIQPHLHKPLVRNVLDTMEFLIIKSGAVQIDFYSEQKEYLFSRDLFESDVVMLCSGGHGFKFLKTSEIIEVKQGPYNGDEEKERF